MCLGSRVFRFFVLAAGKGNVITVMCKNCATMGQPEGRKEECVVSVCGIFTIMNYYEPSSTTGCMLEINVEQTAGTGKP